MLNQDKMLYENHILLFRWMYSSVMLLIMSIQSLNDKKNRFFFWFYIITIITNIKMDHPTKDLVQNKYNLI